MARQKKGKARIQLPAPGDGEAGLAPIPENTASHEGWGNHAQGGEAWQDHQEEAWAEGGADDHGYAPQEDQWAYTSNPGPQTGGWDDTQSQYPHPQQGWVPPTTSPAVNTTVPAGAPAWAGSGRSPQGAYGAPRPPRTAPTQQQYAAAPPQMMPPRPRHDPGANAGGSSWQNWEAEAVANGYPLQPSPPPQRAPGPGTLYAQQYRVPIAGNDPYVPVGGDRAEMNPQAERAIFESILSSRGGAPKQPQQRSARKQSKKSKKERRTQEQSLPNGWGGQQENQGWREGQEDQGWRQENQGWGQENQRWEQENPGWDKEGTGWDRQDAEQEGKEHSAWGQWDNTGAERANLDGVGYTDSEGWNDVTGRKSYRQTVENAFVPRPTGDSPYPMSSRTMAYASGHAQDALDVFSPGLSRQRNTIHDYANMEFSESYGQAFRPVETALFGRERKARDRIHWQFPYDKDERVRSALEWLHDNAHGVGAFGLDKFLQTRERGALFINASYPPAGTSPAFDWLTYDDVTETRDRLLQESVGFYDPAMQVMVFVFLPSKSGNSLAMWRRKVVVPNSVRLSHLREIELAKAALRRDYLVLVDEIRPPPYRLSSLPPPPPMKKKKRGFFRRLFRIFKIVW